PQRPGISPTLGLRAGVAVVFTIADRRPSGNRAMSHQRTMGAKTKRRLASPQRPAARPRRQLSSPRLALRVEQLEDRVTPSINPATPFELDGNVTTTTSHDWDQVFANTSGALAATFVSDAVNTTADDIFTGGGSKDTQGVQQGQWLFTGSKPQGKK